MKYVSIFIDDRCMLDQKEGKTVKDNDAAETYRSGKIERKIPRQHSLELLGAIRSNAENIVGAEPADAWSITRAQRILELCADLEEAILDLQLTASVAANRS